MRNPHIANTHTRRVHDLRKGLDSSMEEVSGRITMPSSIVTEKAEYMGIYADELTDLILKNP